MRRHRYLFKAATVRFSIEGEEVLDRHEMYIGIETDEPLDCDDPRWLEEPFRPVSAAGMTDEELESFGVYAFRYVPLREGVG